MKRKIALVLSMFVILTSSPILGQDENGQDENGTDYQFRLLFHKQTINDEDQEKFGLGGWWVFPDMTIENNTFRSLIVGGLLWRQGIKKQETGKQKTTRWFEFMGGSLIHQNGFIDPLVNVRISERSFKKLDIFADFEYFFRNERFFCWFGGSIPIEIGSFSARIGVESENIIFKNKKDSLGIGPRLILPLPFYKKAILVSAYEFRNDKNFLRYYLVVNF